MLKLQIIIFVVVLVGAQGSKKVFKMDIDERGTRFNESVEIDKEKKTVVYKVPAHNDIDKSETLLDYESGIIATRVSTLKECYIQPIPKDESSLEKTKKNLKLREYMSRKNATIPVKTVSRILIKERLVRRRELSRKVSSFCAGRKIYLVKERSFEDVFGSEVKHEDDVLEKRSSWIRHTIYLKPGGSLKAGLGLVYCKSIKLYAPVMSSCDPKYGQKIRYSYRLKSRSCRYVAHCDPTSEAPGDGSFNIELKCREKHKITSDYCCDVVCV